MKKLFTVFLVVTMFLVAVGSPALAANTLNEKQPISGSYFDPCLGELVDYEGTAHLVSSLTFDGNGGGHVSGHVNYLNLTGTGQSSGAKYEFTGGGNFNHNFRSPYPSTYTEVSTLNVIGKGSAKNLKVQIIFHFTINANGDLTVDFFEFRSSCK